MSIVSRLLDGFRGSGVMFAAVRLGCFDVCRPPHGATTAKVAEHCSAESPQSVARLLDACAALGLLTKTGSDANAVYVNTEESETNLRREDETSLAGYAMHSSKVLWPLWGNLHTAVTSGRNQWQTAFGMSQSEVFGNIYASETDKLAFMQAMHSHGNRASPHVVRAFDLSKFSLLVDIGGATGHLAASAARAYPNLRCVVADLPSVLESSKKFIAQDVENAALVIQGRLGFAPCDFFADDFAKNQWWGVGKEFGAEGEGVGEKPDVVALGRILHDWSDEDSIKILRNVHAALAPGGVVLLAEQLLEESGVGPETTNLQDLNMLVQTHGRERSLNHFRPLLETAGFEQVEGKRTGQALEAVLGRKRE